MMTWRSLSVSPYTTGTLASSEFLIQMGDDGWGVFIVAGGGQMDPGSCDGKTSNTIGYGHADCAGATYSKAGTGLVVANKWQHVAVTVDTTAGVDQVRIYLDGVDQTGRDCWIVLATSSNAF